MTFVFFPERYDYHLISESICDQIVRVVRRGE